MFTSFQNFKKTVKLLAVICGVFVLSGLIPPFASETRAANGGINRQINYQAKLLDSGGTAVTDGTYSVKISLYDAATGGNRLWSATGTVATPTALPISVASGLFTILLGDTSSAGGWQNALDQSVNWNSDALYLGITIASDSEMTPRKRLAAAPQAFNAENLQGMYASSSAYGGQNLFAIHQTLNNAATGTRTALEIKSKGTSNQYDYLLRGVNDLDADVLSINRQGNVTSSGYLAVTGNGTSTFIGPIAAQVLSIGFPTGANVGVSSTGIFYRGSGANFTINADNGYITPVTDLGVSFGSSVLRYNAYLGNVTSTSATSTNFFATNSIFTQATSTNFFSTLGNFTSVSTTGGSTSTDLFAHNARFTSLFTTSATNTTLSATNAVFTNASSTYFYSATGTFAYTSSTNATSTDLFANSARFTNLLATNATDTAWFATTAVFTNGTGTNFFASLGGFTNVTTTGGSTSTDLFATNGRFSRALFTEATSTYLFASQGNFTNVTTTGGSTSTDLFSGNARFTNFSTTNATATTLSATNGYFLNSSTTNATTTFARVLGSITNTLVDTNGFRTATTVDLGAGVNAFAVSVAGHYAYVTKFNSNRLGIFNIQNPAAPYLVSNAVVETGPFSVAVSGRYAYVTGYTSGTLSVVDVSRPAVPTVVGFTAVGGNPQAVAVQGGYAFVTNYASDTMAVVNISNPAQPVVIGLATVTSPNDLTVNGRYVYVVNTTGNAVSVIDIVNPYAPVVVGTIGVGAGPRDITLSGRYAFVSNVTGDSVSILDISNPAIPQNVATSTVTGGPRGIVAAGRYVYVGSNTGGILSVIDAVNPTSPSVLGSWTVGGSPRGIAVAGRYAYVVNNGDNTVSVVDIKGIETNGLVAHSAEVGGLQVRGDGSIAQSLAIGGGLTVGKNGINSDGALFVSATNTTSSIMGNVSVGTSTYGIALNSLFTMNGDDLYVQGNIGSVTSVYTNGAFVAGSGSTYFGNGFINKNDGNLVIQASGGYITPTSDRGVSLGSSSNRYDAYFGFVTTTAVTTTDLFATNARFSNFSFTDATATTLYATRGAFLNSTSTYATTTNLVALNSLSNVISSGTMMTLVTSTAVGETPGGLVIDGKVMYVINRGSTNLSAIDISDPRQPKSLSTTSMGGSSCERISVRGNYLYIICNSGNILLTINITKPSAPENINAATLTLAAVNDVVVQGKYAYSVQNPADLAIIDITAPYAPTVVTTTNSGFPSSIARVVVQGNYAYLARANSSFGPYFRVIDISNPNEPIVRGMVSSTGSTESMAVQGSYAYVSGGGSLRIYNIANPDQPTLENTLSVTALEMQIKGRYLYTTNGVNFTTYDLTSSTNPMRAAVFEVGSTTDQFVVQGRYAYISNSASGTVAIVDLKGVETTSLVAHTAEVGSLSILNEGTIGGGLSIAGGLHVGPTGLLSEGALAISATGTTSTILGNLSVGTTTRFGLLNSLFRMSGSDLMVGNNIGAVSSVYTNGAFVAGSGSTYFGNGFINKNDGNLILQASGGYILPAADQGVSLGSSSIRYNAYLLNVTSTSATTTNLSATNSIFTQATSTNFFSTLGNFTNVSTTVGVTSTDLFAINGRFNRSIFTESTSTYLFASQGNFTNVTTTNGVTSTNLFAVNARFTNTSFTNVTATTLHVAGTSRFVGNLLANSSPVSSTVTQTFNNAAVSSSGIIGSFPSAVIGGDGFPAIAYYDEGNGDLKFTHCTNVTCSTTDADIRLDGSTADVGKYSSMALGVDGFPIISYQDVTNGDLKVAHCLNQTCTSSENFTVDSANVVGAYTSIAIGSNGFPVITHQRTDGIDSYFVACRTWNCSSFYPSVVINSVTDSGYFGHIVVPSDGLPVIAYYEDGGDDLIVAKCLDATCTTLTVTSADATNVVGPFLSMTVARTGLPIISYYDATLQRILVTGCTTAACTAFLTPQAVVSSTGQYANGAGPWTSIAIGSDGMPFIAYTKSVLPHDTNPAIIHCNSTTCSVTSTEVVFSAATDFYGNGTVALRDPAGVPIAIYHATSSAVAVGRTCASDLCAYNGALSGSTIGSPTNYFYRMYSRELYAQQAYLSGFDLAEAYPTNDTTLLPGDVVAVDESHPGKVIKADAVKHPTVVGTVSTKPGLLLTEWSGEGGPRTAAVALAGRVPTAVSMENGPIAIGDLLTLSPTKPGVAMKATGAGMVLGRALEPADTDGLIQVFVQVGYDAGSLLASDGSVAKISSDLVLAPRVTVSSVTTTADSWGLTFRGAAWDGTRAITSDYFLSNEVLGATSSVFSIRDASSTRLFALDQSGSALFRNDLVVGGRLYPSARGVAQTSTYIFVDNSQGVSSTYVSTNAAGWQSDDAYDFAERYYSPDQLTAGDLVVVNERGRVHVQRATNEQQMLVGIVSTKPGFVAGKPASSTFPIALVGRVPTKVSGMKGAIKAGDMIAPSTVPGIGVKATIAGPVVGQALEDYDRPDIGVIEVFVNPVWWGGDAALAGVSGSAATTVVSPTVVTGQSYQGFAIVASGATKVHVSFPSLGAYPNVQATPRGQVEQGWWTDGYTDKGFDIIFAQVQTHDVTFAWKVEPTTQGTQIYLSDGTAATVDSMTGLVVPLTSTATTTTTATVPTNTSVVTTSTDTVVQETAPATEPETPEETTSSTPIAVTTTE